MTDEVIPGVAPDNNVEIKSVRVVWKEIFFLSLPLMSFNLTNILGFIANGLMLAGLGKNQLAAGALIASIQAAIMMVSSAVLFSISSIVSRLNSLEGPKEFDSIIQQAILLAIILCVPAILLMASIKPILYFLKQPSDVVIYVQYYFNGYCLGVPAALLLTVGQHFVLGIRQTRIVTTIGIIGLFAGIGLGYSMAFGKFGLDNYGVSGLGYAQAIRLWISLFILLIFFKANKLIANFELFSKIKLNGFYYVKQIFKLGWPISMQAASEFIAIACISVFAGWIGTMQLSSQQVASQFLLLLSIPAMAISQAANIITGHNIGKNDPVSIYRYGCSAITMAAVFSVFVLCLYLIFPIDFIRPYVDINDVNNSPLILMLLPFLTVIFFSYIFDSIRLVTGFMLRAFYDTKFVMLVSLFCISVGVVPLAYFLGNKAFGLIGFAMAQLVGYIICCIFLVVRWQYLIRKMSEDNLR